MAFGIEVWDDSGNKIMDGSGRKPRVVDVFNPHSIGVPASRTYSDVSPDGFEAILTQGNSRVLTMTVSGTTVSWKYSDGYSWPEFNSSGRIVVTSR